MDSRKIIEVLLLQYTKALNLLEKVISQYDEELWFDNENYGDTAWQIV